MSSPTVRTTAPSAIRSPSSLVGPWRILPIALTRRPTRCPTFGRWPPNPPAASATSSSRWRPTSTSPSRRTSGTRPSASTTSPGYFCSRSACMGRLTGEAVTATFGVFIPHRGDPRRREGVVDDRARAVARRPAGGCHRGAHPHPHRGQRRQPARRHRSGHRAAPAGAARRPRPTATRSMPACARCPGPATRWATCGGPPTSCGSSGATPTTPPGWRAGSTPSRSPSSPNAGGASA